MENNKGRYQQLKEALKQGEDDKYTSQNCQGWHVDYGWIDSEVERLKPLLKGPEESKPSKLLEIMDVLHKELGDLRPILSD